MSQRFNKSRLMLKGFMVTSALLGVVACGSSNNNGGNVNTGTGTGNAQVDTQTTASQVQGMSFAAVQIATAGQSNLKLLAVDNTVPCSSGGTAQVSGEVTPGDTSSFDITLDLSACADIQGSLNIVGTADASLPSIVYDYTVSGDVGANGCLVTFESFNFSVNIPDLLAPLSGNVQFDGDIDADCGAAGFASCVYSALQIALSGGLPSGSVSCN